MTSTAAVDEQLGLDVQQWQIKICCEIVLKLVLNKGIDHLNTTFYRYRAYNIYYDKWPVAFI